MNNKRAGSASKGLGNTRINNFINTTQVPTNPSKTTGASPFTLNTLDLEELKDKPSVISGRLSERTPSEQSATSTSRSTKSYDMFQLDPDDEEHLLSHFNQFDSDGSGSITRKDLGDLLASIGKRVTEEELDKIMEIVDSDGSGSIEFEEFVEIAAEKLAPESQDNEEDQEEIFNFFDVNSSKTLNEDTLFSVCNKKLGLNFSKSQIVEMISYADTNGDGTISLSEFNRAVGPVAYTPRYVKLQRMRESKKPTKRKIKSAGATKRTRKKDKRMKQYTTINNATMNSSKKSLAEQSSTYAKKKNKNRSDFFITNMYVN